MKICKKTMIILLTLIILLYSIITPKNVYAEENGQFLSGSEEAGQIIALFAKNMVEEHASETIYDFGDYWLDPRNPYYNHKQNYGRLMAYQGVKVTGYAQNCPDKDGNYITKYAEDKLFMDCVGFVSFCIHQSLGIPGNGEGNFVAPGEKGIANGLRSADFYYVTDGSLQQGDILVRSGEHVMIYVDAGYVVEAQDKVGEWQVKRRNSSPGNDYVVRIKDSAAKQIRRADTKTSWNGQGTSSGGFGPVVPEVDDSEQFNIYMGEGNLSGLGDSNKFYYNGIPKNGEYLGKTEEENWVFKTLNDAADWILGIMTMGIKIQFVGWANVFEGVANNVVEGLANEELEERITVEDIIYNKVPILDVNIFNFEEAGGQPLETEDKKAEDNIIYILRQRVASWYVVIRTISIIILLFTLIYLGIRTALSSVASEKAEYKQKLVSWVVSFMVVMCIHYFMLIVLNLNQTAVSWIAPSGSTATVYEQLREYAYEIPASKGITGAIVYVFLVYYLIKMLLFYFKRLLIVYILAIVSPALGISYSIQRINGKSKALGIWMREFAFNVLIQLVHAIIYTILMGTVLDFAMDADGLSVAVHCVILFVLLNFMLDAEDIIKDIFKLQSNSLKRVLDTVFDVKNRFAPAIAIASFGYKKGKSVVVNAYSNNLTSKLNTKYDKYKMDGDSQTAQAVNKEIERLKQQEHDNIMELNSNAVNLAKKTFTGTVSLVAGVPALYEKPALGVASFVNTASNFGTGFSKGKHTLEAERLNATTEGTQYLYIEEPDEIEINSINGTVGNRNDNIRINDNANNRRTQRTGTDTLEIQNENITNRVTIETQNESTITREVRSVTGQTTEDTTGAQNGSVTNGETTQRENRRTIRTYNKKKKKEARVTYKAARTVLSWATVGRSAVAEKVIDDAVKIDELVNTVYRTRIEKLSVIGNRALKEVETLNQELGKMQASNYPPIYYTPRPEENKAQVVINEKLREKYREILKKNITQIYGGVDKEKVVEHIVNYEDKVKLNSIEEISKKYLSENECTVGEEFKKNLDNIFREKVIDTINNKKTGFERVKLKEDLQEEIRKAVKDNRGNENRLNVEVDKIVTPEVKEQIVSKLSVKDLTELITKTLETEGSIAINRDFKNLREPLENLKLLSNEAEATSGTKIYSTEEIVNLIMNKDIME